MLEGSHKKEARTEKARRGNKAVETLRVTRTTKARRGNQVVEKHRVARITKAPLGKQVVEKNRSQLDALAVATDLVRFSRPAPPLKLV